MVAIQSLLFVLLFFQAGQQGDLAQLRRFLGANFRSAMQLLDAKNQVLLRTTQPVAPRQAAEMRARMQPPPGLPDGGRPIVPLTVTDIGQGLVIELFDLDFLTEQVNLVFCREPESVIAVQVLFDDRRTLGNTSDLFRLIYGLPAPVAFAQYQPAMRYDLPGVIYPPDGGWQLQPGAMPVTVWDLGTVEALYQPVNGQRLVTGQLWLTDKASAQACPEQ